MVRVESFKPHHQEYFRVEFIQLAKDYKPLNLGQGFPDDLVPNFVLDYLRETVAEDDIMMHQYTRAFVGTPLHLVIML